MWREKSSKRRLRSASHLETLSETFFNWLDKVSDKGNEFQFAASGEGWGEGRSVRHDLNRTLTAARPIRTGCRLVF
jgi:hypothetical protein